MSNELVAVLKSSLYPGAADESINMVLAYCKTADLDVMQKPVHIVPMWDSKIGALRDVVMPGIGLYRIQAARTNEYAGMSEPEFGPDVTEKIGGVDVTYPEWCKVSVNRLMKNGIIATFPAIERWKENYAQKGGKEKSIAPNAMWARRPYGQLMKCAEAQALRKAFPEIGSQPTAEEMEGKAYNEKDMGAAVIVDDNITEAQVKIIKDLLNATSSNESQFCEFMKVEKVETIQSSAFQRAKAVLDAKAARLAKTPVNDGVAVNAN